MGRYRGTQKQECETQIILHRKRGRTCIAAFGGFRQKLGAFGCTEFVSGVFDSHVLVLRLSSGDIVFSNCI